MNGSGMAEALLAERRFTLLEMGQQDHSRRITSLETTLRSGEIADHERDRRIDKLESLFKGLGEGLEGLRGRFSQIEGYNKRLIFGALSGAAAIIFQIIRPKLGL